MILVYNIFSVALLEAKLALLDVLATLAMLTWLLEELQNKCCILKSSEFNFLEDGKGYKRALCARLVAVLALAYRVFFFTGRP